VYDKKALIAACFRLRCGDSSSKDEQGLLSMYHPPKPVTRA
jgi:hypothetical protein